MRTLFTFIVENPFIFILIFLVIYSLITYFILKNKIKEIEKIYRPINDYLIKRFTEIIPLLSKILDNYKEDELVTNEISRLLDVISKSKDGNMSVIISTSNYINNFVLNTALLRTTDYPELNVLTNIELFKDLINTKDEDIELRRKRFNELVIDYNHDILNPPNSIIVKLFGLSTNYPIIEINTGKKAQVAVNNSSKVIAPTKKENEENELNEKKEDIKKICPNCHTEFKNSNLCPTCGSMVD